MDRKTTSFQKQNLTSTSPKVVPPSPFLTGYLLIYNGVLTIGWSLIFYETLKSLLSYRSFKDLSECYGLWKSIEIPLKIYQTAAFLEVIHAALGFVRSNPIIVFIQIISRVFLVWGVANYIPYAQLTPGLLLAVTCWSITEIIRYSYYALNLYNLAPSWLTYCRYTFFIVLYPLGVAGELWTLSKGMSSIYSQPRRSHYSILLPNKYNFGLDYFYLLCIVVSAYVWALGKVPSNLNFLALHGQLFVLQVSLEWHTSVRAELTLTRLNNVIDSNNFNEQHTYLRNYRYSDVERGALELANAVENACSQETNFKFLYDIKQTKPSLCTMAYVSKPKWYIPGDVNIPKKGEKNENKRSDPAIEGMVEKWRLDSVINYFHGSGLIKIFLPPI
ncbi:unnamed protein product [Didymodactylos carnosus]|uniref:Very-long-chain (3R)-3-hydroxyacyl-CoA dehydratase n=1 Tax=Didymodactylos carnosus TaxID=1234261 RepID=A0A813U6G0_9BILA|nr:unnamed protein product [Didymodactylos carnosus]CAF3610875.1 unnamed protein product [Didymodactylos carnosus]